MCKGSRMISRWGLLGWIGNLIALTLSIVAIVVFALALSPPPSSSDAAGSGVDQDSSTVEPSPPEETVNILPDPLPPAPEAPDYVFSVPIDKGSSVLFPWHGIYIGFAIFSLAGIYLLAKRGKGGSSIAPTGNNPNLKDDFSTRTGLDSLIALGGTNEE